MYSHDVPNNVSYLPTHKPTPDTPTSKSSLSRFTCQHIIYMDESGKQRQTCGNLEGSDRTGGQYTDGDFL